MVNKSTLQGFIDEATRITQNRRFAGAPNKAMFWAHTDGKYPNFPCERNNFLCALYTHATDQHAYKMDTLPVIDEVEAYLKKHATQSAEKLDMAWDIFSSAFANQANGNHVFMAANDMRPDDFLQRIELPLIQNRFSHVTTIEPAIAADGMLACKTTQWGYNDWLHAQKQQWQNHDHYLDGQIYPQALRAHEHHVG